MRCSPKEIDYEFVSEEELNELRSNGATNQLRIEIVGTISLREHQSLHNCGWISRTAVHPNYSMNAIGEQLINKVLAYSLLQNYYSVEAVTTECQYSVRELMLRMG